MDFATPHAFAKARNDPDEDDDYGKILEIKTYESRYNSRGVRTRLEAGTQRTERKPKEEDHESALVLTRYYDIVKTLQTTEVEVRSPFMRAALRAVIKRYPGVTFKAGKIILRGQPKCIFHYRQELQQYGLKLEDPDAAQHLLFMLNYMYNTLSVEISSYYTFMESQTVAPGIEYDHLWMAFRPGDLIYTMTDGIHRVLKLKSTEEYSRYFALEVEKIANDGESFGYAQQTILIESYDGYQPLTQLCAFPLRYHPRKDDISKELRARGEKYCKLRGIHHRYYEGSARSLSSFQRLLLLSQTMTVKGRIIVDASKFAQLNPSHKIRISKENPLKVRRNRPLQDSDEEDSSDEEEADGTYDTSKWDGDEPPKLSPNELLICDNLITGFSLSSKRWCFFEVDHINEFEYNINAFESLVLAQDQKSMIHSLVRIHADEGLQFDDLVRGKGKGMIFLLHGEPGVGKTLTAESIADYTKRPLYTVSSGDLGSGATETEKSLTDILDLATRWNAIVLIDEADVFLEQRSHHDLARNGLVSVFLRLLEYYEGIMFLTTNRIGSFDAAFKSRIHLAIKYPALSAQSQKDLWRIFMKSPGWLDEVTLDSLASEGLNGRQIKNIVRTATALALADGRSIDLRDINMSLKAIKDFEQDFSEEKRHTEMEQYDSRRAVGRADHADDGHRTKRQRQE